LSAARTCATVAISSDAKIELQDVVARTSTPGQLIDVHVGDAVSVFVLHAAASPR